MKAQPIVNRRDASSLRKALTRGVHFLAVFLMYLLFCLMVRYQAEAANGSLSPAPPTSRLGAYLTLPAALSNQHANAVVVVRFRIDADGRLTDLRVHTDDASLRQELTRQLSGVKLSRHAGDDTLLYTVRLRFRP